MRRYVWPRDPAEQHRRYLVLQHGGALRLTEPYRTPFMRELAEDAAQISDDELHKLLSVEYRGRLTAAWLIGLRRHRQFRQRLAELLLTSEFVFAGQGYCFALARFGEHADAAILVSYLETYLPRLDCYYDQPWAIGALAYLDKRLGTNRAASYLGPGGMWERSATRDLRPTEYTRMITQLCDFADECLRIGDGKPGTRDTDLRTGSREGARSR